MVIATNAWAAAVPELVSRFICVTSAVVATPPIPERLAEIGWTGGESITDSQTRVDYYRTTRSGRIVFGKGGGRLAFTGEPAAAVFRDEELIAAALRDFRRVYPALAEVPVERSWSGPIDRTYDSLPLIGRLPGADNIAYGVGWSGNGVNPSKVGGRILAGLALGRKERWTENGLVGRRAKRFPPEPVRYLGGNLVLGAVARADGAQIAGRRPSVIDRNLSLLAPAGLEDKCRPPPLLLRRRRSTGCGCSGSAPTSMAPSSRPTTAAGRRFSTPPRAGLSAASPRWARPRPSER